MELILIGSLFALLLSLLHHQEKKLQKKMEVFCNTMCENLESLLKRKLDKIIENEGRLP